MRPEFFFFYKRQSIDLINNSSTFDVDQNSKVKELLIEFYKSKSQYGVQILL